MRNKIIATAALALIIVTVSFYIFSDSAIYTPPPPVSVERNLMPREVTVYISGQVKNPAVVTIEDNGKLRLVDAVNAVGGLTEFADTEFVNLAEPLIDGQHVHIPTKEIIFQEIPIVTTNSRARSQTSNDLVNINTADSQELQKLKGVGPAIAGRIIEYREQNGAFRSIDDIKKVRGIGEKIFEKMKDSITV